MKTKEKLERAGWQFKELCGRIEMYERGFEKVAYDQLNDTVVSWSMGEMTKSVDAFQLELLFDK